MNYSGILAYKKECFAGKGLVARGLDRLFLSLLGGLGVYVLLAGKPGRLVLSLLLGAGLLTVLLLLDKKRFDRFMLLKRQRARERLQLLHFIQNGGEGALPEGEEAIFSLEPVTLKELQARCLQGRGKVFRLYQKENKTLARGAEELGCRVHFCPEAVGKAQVSPEEVEGWLWGQVPKRKSLSTYAQRLNAISGKRFLLAGGLMTLLSFFLPYSLFFRLLGTAAFLYGSISLSLSLVRKL